MTPSDEAVLDARAARLYHRYCAAVDDGDLDLLATMLADDVRLTRPDGTRQGVEPFLDVYREFVAARTGPSMHVVSNVIATPGPDGTVTTRAMFMATMLQADVTRVVHGAYADTHVERDGGYLIAHKVNVIHRVVELPLP